MVAILWKCATYFTIGFMGTFKTDTTGNGLAMTLTTVNIIAMVANAVRIFITKPIAKYSDKRSFAAGFYLSMFIAVAAFACNIFTTEKTWFLVIGYTVLYSVCAAGSGQNAYNMTYSYVDSNYIAEAMALQNCISGVCGFCARWLRAGFWMPCRRTGTLCSESTCSASSSSVRSRCFCA